MQVDWQNSVVSELESHTPDVTDAVVVAAAES